MSNRKTQNSFALLGGALAGAAAMYLLDPEAGQRRRRTIGKTAGEALHSAEELASRSLGSVAGRLGDRRDSAQGLAQRAVEMGQSAAGTARDYAADLAERARDAGSDAAQRVADSDAYQDSAGYLGTRLGSASRRIMERARGIAGVTSDSAHDVASRAGGWFGRAGNRAREMAEPSTPVLPITLTGIGCVAMGAGAMYFLDAKQGRSRRAHFRDKARGVLNEISQVFRRTGRHVRNQMQGVVAETQNRYFSGGGYVSGEQLLERVRAELGHAVSNPRMIQVMTDGAGCVTLTGQVLNGELQPALRRVRDIAGVREVLNRLEGRESIEQQGEGDGARQRSQTVPQL